MCKGNRLRAAQVLGIGSTSLYRYLKENGYDQTLTARSKAAGNDPGSRLQDRMVAERYARVVAFRVVARKKHAIDSK